MAPACFYLRWEFLVFLEVGETRGQEPMLTHCWQRFTAGIGGSAEAVPGLHSEALEGCRVRHHQAGPPLLLC